MAGHILRRPASLFFCKIVALCGAFFDVAAAAEAIGSIVQRCWHRELHDSTDRCHARVLLELLETHAQIELQEFHLGLKHGIGGDRKRPGTAEVVRNQRVKLRGDQLQLLGVSTLLQDGVELVQNILALANLSLRKLAHGGLVLASATLRVLGLDNGILAVYRLEVVTCSPIVACLLAELFLEFLDGISWTRERHQFVLPRLTNAPPAIPSKVFAIALESLNDVIFVVVCINVCLVQLHGVVFEDLEVCSIWHTRVDSHAAGTT
mmetsp:Transcript_85921/g.170546  ORF Transcript_85921/g.170546 Transcript_85921/m.170546 type:complete len:264 (-) Transcript_85921:292-1083(-)